MAPKVVPGANTTLMVQLAPTAKVAPHVPPAVPVGCENSAVPPPKVKVPPARAELPEFVTVSVRALLVVPVAQLPKASGLGDTVAVWVTAAPVPLSETGEPATATLAVMVAVPVAAPVAVGVNTTLMVQVVVAAKVAPHVPPAAPVGLENGTLTATEIPVAPAVPVLDSVSCCEALVLPSTVLGNVRDVGATLRIAITGAWNSTAPASTALFAFLELPKKSKLGAAA
jgi:hypothetical protein